MSKTNANHEVIHRKASKLFEFTERMVNIQFINFRMNKRISAKKVEYVSINKCTLWKECLLCVL